MFDFLDMVGNYEQRKVANYEDSGLVIDTCAVTDSSLPFETGICHPLYNDGKWIIVELYSDKESAMAGHEKWVSTMTVENLPPELRDVSGIVLTTMIDDIAENDWRVFRKAEA